MTDTDDMQLVPPELPEVRILRLAPGDVLLFRCERRLTDAEFDYIAERVKDKFPGHECALLDGGMTLDILRRQAGD